jgi:hypothetical protein
MTNSSDGHHGPLPDELAAALQRATDRTLVAFNSLRIAVREHVQSERSRGATLSEIDSDLRSMITVAGGDASHDHQSERIEELTKQVLKWSESFFSGDGKRTDGQGRR